MGIKSLSLQMIPWCFHMGNHVSCVQLRPDDHEPRVRTIKLIQSDGTVKIYHRPISVSELMLEFPKHLVCRSDSFYIGQKIPALSENAKLQLGHKYFLLPKHLFQSVLSFVTIASFASSNHSRSAPVLSSSNNALIMRDHSKNAFVKKAASSNCQPFIIRKSPSGSLQIRVSDEFISNLMQEGRIKDGGDDDDEDENSARPKGKICTTPQLQKEYSILVESRQWKPKLETIRESKRRKLGSFGIKRRKKTQSKGTQQKSTPRSETVPSSSKSTKVAKNKGKRVCKN